MDQKQNTKNSTEIKISHNVEQDTSPEFLLDTNKRKFEERNNNFTNKRFRNYPNNTPETIQSYLIKRKINHGIDRSHKKQKVDNDNISNTSATNIKYYVVYGTSTCWLVTFLTLLSDPLLRDNSKICKKFSPG